MLVFQMNKMSKSHHITFNSGMCEYNESDVFTSIYKAKKT